MLRSLFKQSSVYFTALIGGKALTTLAWILFARIFTPELTGSILFYISILEISTFIADFGLNQWYMKYADEFGEAETYRQAVSARFLTLFASWIILTPILIFTGILDGFGILVCLTALISEAFLSIGDSFYLRKKQSYRIAFKGIFTTVLFLTGILLFRANLSFTTIIILYSAVRTAVCIWYFPWEVVPGLKIISLRKILRILRSSSSYAMLIVSSYLYARGDALIIGYIAGPAALSLYGLSYRYLEGLSLFPSALTQNLFPISAKKNGISKGQVIKMSLFMAVAGALAGAVLFAGADFLIMILGSQYVKATPVLRIFSVVLFLFFINAPIAAVVQSSKYVKQFLPYGIVNTLVNLILNILIVPVYGIYGAAWVMAATETSGFLINLFFVNKLYERK